MLDCCKKLNINCINLILLISLLLIPVSVSSSEILYDGPFVISDNPVGITSYVSNKTYDIADNTPLGLLASVPDLSLKVSDKKYQDKGILLLDGIGSYEYNKGSGNTWVCEINGVVLNDYANPETEGLNIKKVTDDDTVVFYYGKSPITSATAIASLKFSNSGSNTDSVKPSSEKKSLDKAPVISQQMASGNDSYGSWSLHLNGAISDTINQSFFEEAASCHSGSWKDKDGNEYTGLPVWRLLGWVDDNVSHGKSGFNQTAFDSGYTIIVKAGDGFTREFSTTDIGTSDDVIIANQVNGKPLAKEGEKPSYPLKLVGPNITGGNSVGNIVEIQLTGLPSLLEEPKESAKSTENLNTTSSSIPKVHVVLYAQDGKSVLNETTVDYQWMEKNLPVIGDGKKEFRYEGITNNPKDIWDSNLSFPGGFKIKSAVKGTLIKDLVDLVGGMEPGTSVKLVASDGYETKLGYSSVYPNPDAIKKAGEPFIAWNKDGKNVPEFKDGYQLFFTGGDDQTFSNWDMHDTMDSNYWHYYWEGGVQYPSAAGLASKYIDEIQVFSVPESAWKLDLDGSALGGVETNISSGYFDSALVCQFGSNHSASYTDHDGKIWKGMPLWFLAGFVDDADQHSNNAYNESLADNGYQIIITGKDGTTKVIDSTDAKRNDKYIIASTVDGAHLSKDDPSWPLILTGSSVSEPVLGVSKIELKPLN
ncbi:molybdopterin-binding protein [Methanospirillum lacunae]|uniref:DUF4430 domain-containing protein n=1 Tax=Methanospirillum lacunae TaxID=668570 RepID=A0A2V2NGL9_9EURY|nr:hypothetical protein [Methanospirillum lacunae]PWR74473.1 hypothetical protein DK846_04830 [Methanospirillum lacunae]